MRETVTSATTHAGCEMCDNLAGAILAELRVSQSPVPRTVGVVDRDGYHIATVSWSAGATVAD